MTKFVTIFLSFLAISNLYGQLVTQPNSAVNLVQNVLLGSGVTVSGISQQGQNSQFGSFTATNSNLGINSGIVITTGTIFNTGAGPHGPNNQIDAGVALGGAGSPMLTSIVGNTTHDAAIIQFNLVPYSDTVRFRYVFGSEEYLEYCGTQFNDIFGFFISGPGIVPDGSFGSYRNIARIPGSGVPVAINNVHSFVGSNINGNQVPAQNPAYYVNNNGGATIQYDGFTVPLEAVAKVQCGQTYNLIIAIADVGDGIYDSGIFLEANSLTSKTPVDIDYQISFDAFNDPSLMAEGCVSATFTLTRDNNINQALTIPINVSGTATEGVDYTNIPNSVTFAPGQSTIQFSFDALADNITEAIESIILEFLLTDPCGNVTPMTFQLGIRDVENLVVTLPDTSVYCAGDAVTLIPQITGGVGPYLYSWDTGETTASITVSPPATQSYTVTVTDNCIIGSSSGTGTVTVPIYPPISLVVTDDITEICPYLPADLMVTASGGTGVYTYQWSASNGQQLGQGTTQNVIPSTTTTYFVEVTDECDAVANEQVLYTITSPPLVVTMSPGIEVCPGDSAFITTSVTGGYGQYFYFWPHSGETTPNVWVNPAVTTQFMVSVSDECQTFTVPGYSTITVVKPTANFVVSSKTLFDDLPITFQNLTINGNTYEWSFGDGNTSTMVHPNNTYMNPGTYLVTLIATDEKGCKDTIQKYITIVEAHYIYIPNTFTPQDGDRFNGTFFASVYGIATLKVQIFNRWGQLVFQSNNPRFEWDGTYNGNICQDGTYTYKITYRANSGFEDKITGHVNLLR